MLVPLDSRLPGICSDIVLVRFQQYQYDRASTVYETGCYAVTYINNHVACAKRSAAAIKIFTSTLCTTAATGVAKHPFSVICNVRTYPPPRALLPLIRNSPSNNVHRTEF